MNKFITGTLALGLLLTTAACGSDEKSSDTTTAAAETVVSTVDSATDETATDETVAASGTPQEQVLAQTIAQITAAGFEFDEACIAEGIAQLSDEDAQAILDAGETGSPDVSPEGEAIGSALQSCVTEPTITT